MPLEAQLDIASNVVLGKITAIEPVKENIGPGSYCGKATIAVEEALKGEPLKAIQFNVVTGADPIFMQQSASIVHSQKVGDAGIWVVQGGWSSQETGLIPESRKMEVQSALKTLAERKWSEPANGLRACAVVVHPEWERNPVLLFAVNNVSKETLYVPHPGTPGFVCATVTDREDNRIGYVLLPGPHRMHTLYCDTLPPGGTLYLHPDYSFIDLARHERLGSGKYSVVVYCQNERTEGEANRAENNRVTAWIGELSAPPVGLEIAAPP